MPGVVKVTTFDVPELVVPVIGEPVAHVARDTTFYLKVRLYGTDPAPFTLYEDDGESFDYERGAQNRVVLGLDESVRREGGWKGVRYRILGWERIGS